MVRWVGLAGCLLLSCRESSPPVNDAPLVRAVAAASATTLVSNVPRVGSPSEEQWVESMRSGDFREAARRIDLLTPVRVQDPDIRYARARAALALGDFARARTLLEKLDEELPLLADDIRRDRAECARHWSVRRRGAIFSRRGSIRNPR